MNDLLKSLPHMIIAVVVIAAAVVLSSEGVITGGEAIGLIGTAGGFTLGGTVASTSISSAARAAVDVSHSGSGPNTPTTTPTPSLPGTPPAQP